MRLLRALLRSQFITPVRPHVLCIKRNPLQSPSKSLSTYMETVNTSERLAQLRELMKQHGMDIYGKPKCATFWRAVLICLSGPLRR